MTARFSIGVVIAAGMTIGTLFTLFVTPAMYTYIARDHQKAKARLEAEAAGQPAAKGPSAEEMEELDAAAGAGVLFPAEEDEAAQGQFSREAEAIGSAADAASLPRQSDDKARSRRRPGRRKGLPQAAE